MKYQINSIIQEELEAILCVLENLNLDKVPEVSPTVPTDAPPEVETKDAPPEVETTEAPEVITTELEEQLKQIIEEEMELLLQEHAAEYSWGVKAPYHRAANQYELSVLNDDILKQKGKHNVNMACN